MDENSRAIIHVLNALTCVSIEDFYSRLKLQKLTYLAREMGCDCGFAFDWYVRGPYSPSLTRALFSADELGELRMEKVELSDSERAVVEDINDFLGDDINNARALELIASVWYLLPEGRLSNEISSRVVDELQKCKPEFKREELESTVEKIISFRKKKRGTK